MVNDATQLAGARFAFMARLKQVIGDQKIDLVLQRAGGEELPIHAQAKQQGGEVVSIPFIRYSLTAIMDRPTTPGKSHCSLVCQRGFTLVELIMTMIVIGILAAVAAPRFFDANVFKSRGFADQVQASLRYAQKEAIAQHRNVCVAMTASTITLTIANASGAASLCGPNLALPAGGNSISAPSVAITLTLLPAAPATFNFDALGKPFDVLGITPSAQKSITISGATNIIYVEAETGYVHSP
jgi:MSHA pilin protein MshC